MKDEQVDTEFSHSNALSRRRFSTCVIATACSTLPGLSAAATAPQPAPFQPDHLPSLQLARFEPLVGRRFRVWSERGDDGQMVLTQASALDVPAANRHLIDPNDPSFSLLFERAGGRQLSQATYRLTHWRFGNVDLFVVPVRSENRRELYEAIVQRFTAL